MSVKSTARGSTSARWQLPPVIAIQMVMVERGYPVEDFEQRSADISVDHPDVVENYRDGHRLAQLSASGDGRTEDLRQAMGHYRALFDELVEDTDRARDMDADSVRRDTARSDRPFRGSRSRDRERTGSR